MTEFIKTINKYAIILIISSLFGMPWSYICFRFFQPANPESLLFTIPHYADYLIKLIVIALLIFDLKKYDLKNTVITCIAALFFPLLGVVIFSILLLEKERNKANI